MNGDKPSRVDAINRLVQALMAGVLVLVFSWAFLVTKIVDQAVYANLVMLAVGFWFGKQQDPPKPPTTPTIPGVTP